MAPGGLSNGRRHRDGRGCALSCGGGRHGGDSGSSCLSGVDPFPAALVWRRNYRGGDGGGGAGLAGELPASVGRAGTADPAGRPVKSVPVSGVKAEPAAVSQSQREPWSPSGAAWPAAGVSVVDLPAAARARAGGLPVWAGRPSSGAPAAGPRAGGSLAAAGGPSRLRVEVLDRAAAERAGVAGVLLRLSWVDSPSAAGAASVEVDYSGFRGVCGADWAARL